LSSIVVRRHEARGLQPFELMDQKLTTFVISIVRHHQTRRHLVESIVGMNGFDDLTSFRTWSSTHVKDTLVGLDIHE
jgi:hypothetical protein